MRPIAISWVVFAWVFAGSLLEMQLHHILPKDYVNADLQSLINMVTGLIATMSALVLALQRNELTQTAASLILLDRRRTWKAPMNSCGLSFEKAQVERFALSRAFALCVMKCTSLDDCD